MFSHFANPQDTNTFSELPIQGVLMLEKTAQCGRQGPKAQAITSEPTLGR